MNYKRKPRKTQQKTEAKHKHESHLTKQKTKGKAPQRPSHNNYSKKQQEAVTRPNHNVSIKHSTTT